MRLCDKEAGRLLNELGEGTGSIKLEHSKPCSNAPFTHGNFVPNSSPGIKELGFFHLWPPRIKKAQQP
jgi:hypothetical protein